MFVRDHIIFLAVFICVTWVKEISGANILCVNAVASPSHHIWNRQIALGLVQQGHNVTMLTHNNEKGQMPKNFTILLIEDVYERIQETYSYVELYEKQSEPDLVADARMLFDWGSVITSLHKDSPAIKHLYNYPRDFRFDLIIHDVTTSQWLYPLNDRFGKPPVIAVTPLQIPTYINLALGNHEYPSYTPFIFGANTNKMSFYQRAYNLIQSELFLYMRRNEYMQAQEQVAREVFGDEFVRPLAEYEKEFALLLCNYDPLISYPQALPANVVPVGGLHARPGGKLPADLQKIMDEAKHGVVLFSLGTNIKSTMLKVELRNKIVEVLGRLKQTVIWKFEAELDDLPKNVIIRKWLPQNDMMEHPNMVLFITHGGALSTQEAMYHGIPVVGIPFFADQLLNVRMMSDRKVGRFLYFSNIIKTNHFYEAVSDVLNDPQYLANSRRLSRLLKERPQSALDTALFWIDRTLKFGKIHELQLPTVNMTFIEIYNLDVYFAAISILTIILASIVLMIKKLCCSTKSTKQKKH